MALSLSTEQINQLLVSVDQLSTSTPQEVLGTGHPGWRGEIDFLYERSTPLTYLPVLCVTLVARSLSPDVQVKRIQVGDEYSSSLVGNALVRYGRDHHIDMRTDSTNVMNNQPFIRKAEITPDLNPEDGYARFYAMVEKVQNVNSAQAKELLALVFQIGRQNWPNRYRRVQRNQASTAVPLSPTTSGTTDTVASFILNRSSEQNFTKRDGKDYYGFMETVTSAQALVAAGGGQFVYYNTSKHIENRMCFVGYGHLSSVEEGPLDEEGRRTWVARVADYNEFDKPVPKVEGAPPQWNSQHSIVKISGDSFDRIVDLGMGRRREPEPLTVDGVAAVCLSKDLLLPRTAITALVAALNSGKHVILTGPPGTAKTTLAVLVAQVAAAQNLCAGHLLTTATADWSTYDTIGGLAPTVDNQLTYRPGRFVEAIASDLWLVVDELNRSNFDRAFGQLFTVLAGADVTLPYNDAESDLPVRITWSATNHDSRYQDIVVSRDWRMLGTINNFDKSLLFEMSFALMRRFAFVEVPAPSDEAYFELISEYAEDPNPAVTAAAVDAVVALLPLRTLKQFGPAIFIDAAKLARQLVLAGSSPSDTVFTVFYALMLPQFEGLDESRGAQLLRLITKAVPRRRKDAIRVLREVLGLELGRATASNGDADDDVTSTDELEPSKDQHDDRLAPPMSDADLRSRGEGAIAETLFGS